MIGRLSWLGGRSTPQDDADSRNRAAAHRRRVTRDSRRSSKAERKAQVSRPRWND